MLNVHFYSISIMNVFDRRYEMMPRAELEQLQLERLQALLVRLKRNVRRAREKSATPMSNRSPTCRACRSPCRKTWWKVSLRMFALPMREINPAAQHRRSAGKPLVIATRATIWPSGAGSSRANSWPLA